VMFGGLRDTSGAYVVSSVTIGGVAATPVYSSNVDAVSFGLNCWYAKVPTGTTADIVIVHGANMNGVGIAVFNATGLDAVHDYAVAGRQATGTAALSLPVDIPAGGFVCAYASDHDTSTFTWNESLTEHFDGAYRDTKYTHTSASKTYSSAASPTITVTPTQNGIMNAIAVVFRPTSSGLNFGDNGFLLEGSNGLSNYPIATADMTGASAPSGDVTSSAANGDEPNWHAFDRNAATYWGASGVGGVATLTYQFDTSKTIASYSIQNRSGGTDGHPENWKIQGSNNGSSFDDLHTVTGQDFGTSAINYYTFNNTTAYTYYRLNITESQADAGPIVAEWAMYETQDTSGNGAGVIKTGTITATNDSPTNGDA